MSEESQEKKTKKISLGNLKANRKFLVLVFFLLISVVTIVFATRDLFDSNADDWTVTQGGFEGSEGSLQAISSNLNWAFHKSETAYGEWFWSFRYFGSGSASVIFIGFDQDSNYYYHSKFGYKLEMEVGKSLSLVRLDGLGIEIVLTNVNYEFIAQNTYNVRISRTVEDNFTISINDVLKLSAIDSTYSTSDVFELDWFNRHTLTEVVVTDFYGIAGWEEYFTGLPIASSKSVLTQIALYIPFGALALVVVFYIFRLLLTEGNWIKFLVPLLLAIIIGTGFGFLFDYFRNLLPEEGYTIVPSTNSTETPNISSNNTSINPSFTPSQNNTNNGGGEPPIQPLNKDPISLILLVISGIFILMMVSFVLIDFFKKRDDEYHEKIITKDVRWLPKVTETDHRKRVIRSYHKTSYDLIDHGATSERSMTPGEFEEKATEKFEFDDEAFDMLTDLYEEARFSEHEISSHESERAESIFNKVTDELKTKNVEHKKSEEELIELDDKEDKNVNSEEE